MQQTNNNNPAQEESVKKSISIGALLVSARNAAAFNQTDVAEQINLPRSTIKALEEDDFENLPESTYVRGYLRNYARAVAIDADSLIKVYDEQYHQEPVIDPGRCSGQSYDPTILWSTAAVLSILVGLVITWWFDNNEFPESAIELVSNQTPADHQNSDDGIVANNASSADAQPNSESVDEATEQESQVSESSLEETEQSATENSITEVITEDQQLAMEEESKNPNLITSIDGAQVITVTYVEKSWTEIRDADSNTLMQGLIEPGVVRNLSGKPPFEIFLGNAPGVVIEVNGLYFDHSQYSRSNRTARFQVSSGSLN